MFEKPNPAMDVQNQGLIGEAAGQAVLDPIEDVLAAEEQARLDDGRSGDIWIYQIIHGDLFGRSMPYMNKLYTAR